MRTNRKTTKTHKYRKVLGRKVFGMFFLIFWTEIPVFRRLVGLIASSISAFFLLHSSVPSVAKQSAGETQRKRRGVPSLSGAMSYGYGSKRKPLGTTGFGLCFLLPLGFFRCPFMTHTHILQAKTSGLLSSLLQRRSLSEGLSLLSGRPMKNFSRFRQPGLTISYFLRG